MCQSDKLKKENVNLKDKLVKKPQAGNAKPQQTFRGAIIHISEKGQFGLELKDCVILEVYAALTLVLEHMKKDLNV